jgi:hypothetical protein
MGADVVKLEAPGGDITRKPLRDIPDVDSFYVTGLRLPDQTVRLPGRRPPLTPAGRDKRGHLRRELGREDQLASLKTKGVI